MYMVTDGWTVSGVSGILSGSSSLTYRWEFLDFRFVLFGSNWEFATSFSDVNLFTILTGYPIHYSCFVSSFYIVLDGRWCCRNCQQVSDLLVEIVWEFQWNKSSRNSIYMKSNSTHQGWGLDLWSGFICIFFSLLCFHQHFVCTRPILILAMLCRTGCQIQSSSPIAYRSLYTSASHEPFHTCHRPVRLLAHSGYTRLGNSYNLYGGFQMYRSSRLGHDEWCGPNKSFRILHWTC